MQELNVTTVISSAPEINWGELSIPNFGTLRLAWSSKGLVALLLPSIERDFGALYGGGKVLVPRYFSDPLKRYFAGRSVDPALLPVDLRGTEFQVRVWNALREIPRGRVRSYALIAAKIGSPRAMRAVGLANGSNPIAIVVPCHRVVRHDGAIGGYTGGLEIKRKLLELEGCRVAGDRVFPGQTEFAFSRDDQARRGSVARAR